MLIVYVFPTIYQSRSISITQMLLTNKHLDISIEFESVPLGLHDASAPGQRCLVVKLKKLDMTEVTFNLINPLG